MKLRASQSGFTLLEVLVASMLMAMLVTILTMVFNSSSIAWSLGRAGVAEMDKVRMGLSGAHAEADNAVPGIKAGNMGSWGYLVGPWDSKGNLRPRAIENTFIGGTFLGKPSFGSGEGSWVYDTEQQLWGTYNPENITIVGNANAYAVGVWSYGPDGEPDSGDDISTWPDLD